MTDLITSDDELGPVLGREHRQPRRQLDTIPVADTIEMVKFVSEEVTSLCPVTGQPDYGTVTIRLWPSDARLGVETKSLKLYLWSFRDQAMFCEALAARIARDIRDATQAFTVDVNLEQQIRGGIVTTARAVAR